MPIKIGAHSAQLLRRPTNSGWTHIMRVLENIDFRLCRKARYSMLVGGALNH